MINKQQLAELTHSPREFLSLLYSETREDGSLYLPVQCFDGENEKAAVIHCRVKWNYRDCEDLAYDAEQLFRQLELIAAAGCSPDTLPADVRRKLHNDTLINTWETYVRAISPGQYNMEEIERIRNKEYALRTVRELELIRNSGRELTAQSAAFLHQNRSLRLTEEETAYLNGYLAQLQRQAAERLRAPLCAAELIRSARRLCKLHRINAPAFVLRSEMAELSAALLMNRCGTGMEEATEADLRRIEAEDRDEDGHAEDRRFRPKKINSRKSLAPLFVYLILKNNSSPHNPLKQKDILELLRAAPYEVDLERKALSRILHNLEDSQLHVHSENNVGVWYDPHRE